MGIFGPKREEVAGGWRTLHNEELRNTYASPNIIRLTKSRSMGWAGHVAIWQGVYWIHVAHEQAPVRAHVNKVMNIRVNKSGEFLD
jgi:hypothetical protein